MACHGGLASRIFVDCFSGSLGSHRQGSGFRGGMVLCEDHTNERSDLIRRPWSWDLEEAGENDWKDLSFPWCLLPDNLGLEPPLSFLTRLARFFNPSSEPDLFVLRAFSLSQEIEGLCNVRKLKGERPWTSSNVELSYRGRLNSTPISPISSRASFKQPARLSVPSCMESLF